MPNSDDHIPVGMGIGAFTYLLYKNARNEKPTLEGIAGSGIAGAIFGVLPDLIEPASNPNHRGFFHSKLLGATIPPLMKELIESEKTHPNTKLAIGILGFSYLSHLALDSQTPKGLPWL